MTKETLVRSAFELTVPDAASSGTFRESADGMAADLTRRMLGRDDLYELIGPGNQTSMETNHVNHFRFMSSLLAVYDPDSFVETVIWVFRTYMAKGYTPQYWQVMLPEAMEVVSEHLSRQRYQQISPFYEWLFERIADIVRVSGDTLSFYERIGTMQGSIDEQRQ